MGKLGSISHFSVLCLLAFGDTALKSWFLLAFGAHEKGCRNEPFRAFFFRQLMGIGDPKVL